MGSFGLKPKYADLMYMLPGKNAVGVLRSHTKLFTSFMGPKKDVIYIHVFSASKYVI